MAIVNTALTLKDLPNSPEYKTGWPWTEQTEPLPDKMPNGSEWPRISIVTPNYNYGHFIEETIRSVLLQGYPNLEYIIIDGGSTDNSVEVIKKYEKFISYWVSEKDYGQSNAINKGIKKATGKIFNWLNSDDIFNLSALSNIASIWSKTNPTILVGSAKIIDLKEYTYWVPDPSISPLKLALHCQGGVGMAQPSTFLSLDYLKLAGGVNEDLHYIMDYTLYLNLFLDKSFAQEKLVITDKYISIAKLHEKAKTSSSWNLFEKETIQVLSDMVSKFTLNEQKIINKHIYQLTTQVAVRDSLKNRGISSLISLLKLLLAKPSFIYSRFYVGALKNIFIEIFNN